MMFLSVVWTNVLVLPVSLRSMWCWSACWAWICSIAAPLSSWQRMSSWQYKVMAADLAITAAMKICIILWNKFFGTHFHFHIIQSMSMSLFLAMWGWLLKIHDTFFQVHRKLGGAHLKLSVGVGVSLAFSFFSIRIFWILLNSSFLLTKACYLLKMFSWWAQVWASCLLLSLSLHLMPLSSLFLELLIYVWAIGSNVLPSLL